MFMSRAFLNAAHPEVRQDLEDFYGIHRKVLGAFPRTCPSAEDARAHHGVLHRLDADLARGLLVLYVQSKSHPQWDHFPQGYFVDLLGLDNPSTTPIETNFAPGAALRFHLRANPTRRVGSSGLPQNCSVAVRTVESATIYTQARCGPTEDYGKRVELLTDEERLAWFMNRAKNAGFKPEEPVELRCEPLMVGYRPNPVDDDKQITFGSVVFNGRLRVVESETFRKSLEKGVGPGKAFGLGLLTVKEE